MTTRGGGQPPGQSGQGGGPRPYAMRLDAEQCGTLLGAVAWVMGALAILEDRGHAAGDERLHEQKDALMPKLERLVSELGGVRAAAGANPEREADVEAAYSRVRAAFESWVQVTAADTVQAALVQRLGGEGE